MSSPELGPEVVTVLNEMEIPEYHKLSIEELRSLTEPETVDQTDQEPVGNVENRSIPGPSGELSVRVYTPTGEGPFPAFVYFHGGGFVRGTLDGHDSTCRALTNATESVVVSVAYRLAPEAPFPAAVEDAYAASKWVVDNTEVLNTAPGRLIVGGNSSGGNLAAVVALMARNRGSLEINHQVLVYPAVTFDREWPSYQETGEGYWLTPVDREWIRGHYLDSDVHTQNPYAAPFLAPTLEGLPPATIVTAEFDPFRDEGTAYAERLAEAGVDVAHHHYEGMIHGFFTMLDEPFDIDRARVAIDDVATDLAENLGE